MKKFLILSAIVVAVSSFAFVAKPKDATGTLIVKIEMPNGEDKNNADIDVALSERQLINMDYVASKSSDKAGAATFTLEEGTYWVGVTHAVMIGGYPTVFNGMATVKVTAGKKTKASIKLVQSER